MDLRFQRCNLGEVLRLCCRGAGSRPRGLAAMCACSNPGSSLQEKELLSLGTGREGMLVPVEGLLGNAVTFFTECRTCFLPLASSINTCVRTCMCQCLSETLASQHTCLQRR